ncbi:hypothetical protein NKH47_04050 [Mesorhizobium sp. M1060]|uniref:hypothetical protein n=1 Tax=unclassified Mesorhizobium TaxID=325217 RepID=UPI0004CFE70E|nr:MULTISPECIES: hypothetical protein [unclassified Mesorhizobium]WJI52348.1 hypothetical protein NLY44_06650 [Mesorhizobium sp. C089B]
MVDEVAPPLRYFKAGDPVHVRAQQVWLILVSKVMSSPRNPQRPTVMTYGDLAETMGMDRRAGITLNRQLGVVGDICVANDLPALNCIVINDRLNAPGDHVVTRPGRTWQQEQADAMSTNWFTVRVPTTGTLRKIRSAAVAE